MSNKAQLNWFKQRVTVLEKENAELKEQIATVSAENRRLRQVVAAPAMLTWAMHGKDLP